MSESAAFYEEILYPLQTGVLSALANCSAPFYLTGGTALHRHYFDYRFSDDLDLFVNRDPGFPEYTDQVLDQLRSAAFRWEAETTVGSEAFVRVVVKTADASVQLDLVNDTAPRFGPLVSGALFPRMDNLHNMLSNKITALPRLEAKDAADIWTIARHKPFRWSDVLRDAGKKEAGIAPGVPADLLRSFPPARFDSIQWRRPPDRDRFLADLRQIARDLLEVRPNSLAAPNPTPGAENRGR